MENLVKGWFTSGLGIVLIILGIVHVFGFYEMPNPEIMDTYWKKGLYFLISFSLFLFSKTKIETVLESLVSSVVSLFKKKVE